MNDKELILNAIDHLNFVDNQYNWQSKETLHTLLGKVKKLSLEEKPTHDSVVQLMIDVNEQTKPPLWWEDVKFQFHYKSVEEDLAENEKSQCSGPPSPLIASVNEYTQVYLDDSDGRQGWCELKWGIVATAPETASWFINEVSWQNVIYHVTLLKTLTCTL